MTIAIFILQKANSGYTIGEGIMETWGRNEHTPQALLQAS